MKRGKPKIDNGNLLQPLKNILLIFTIIIHYFFDNKVLVLQCRGQVCVSLRFSIFSTYSLVQSVE